MTKNILNGLIQIYTGDGKGKTTAAVGQAVRASGQGLKVIFIQFIKGIDSGEHIFISEYHPFEINRLNSHDYFQKNGEDITKYSRETLELASMALGSGKYDIVVLDEIFIAHQLRHITTQEIIKLMDIKPASVELIMTGRYAPAQVIERADLVTEMKAIKHPYNKGVTSRKGIEY